MPEENTSDYFNFLNNPFKEFVESISGNPIQIVEIGVLAFIVWKIYLRIKGTQAEQLLKGILVIVAAFILSNVFNLQIISRVLENLLSVVLVGLVVIFQPELRRILGYLGQSGMFSKNLFTFSSEDDIKKIIDSICDAVKHLSKKHIGALIVLEDTPSMESYLEVGTPLDANVTTELILTLFHPNTPLHDGAIIISGNKVIAAGVLLPLTEDPKLSWQYGTRHRAAIGMSEVSSSQCIVVSEETGEISVAKEGVLKKYTEIDELRKILKEIYDKHYPAKKNNESSSSNITEFLSSDISKISNMFQGTKK